VCRIVDQGTYRSRERIDHQGRLLVGKSGAANATAKPPMKAVAPLVPREVGIETVSMYQ
jgi:hypothetical protein